MLFLDAFIRISAVTMLLWLSVMAVRDIRPSRSWLYLVLASLSTAALFLSLSSKDLALPERADVIVGFINVPHLIFIWLFVLSVFQTKFRLSQWHIVIGIIYTLPLFWFRAYQTGLVFQPPFFLNIGISIGSILLMGHLVWTILREHNDDLIDVRKRSRRAFVIVLVGVTILTALVDLYLIISRPNHALLIKASTIWPAVFAAFFWTMRASTENFIEKTAPESFAQAENHISGKDAPVFERLQRCINEDHIYLDPALTISGLAKRLGVTSHRLRALINQSMGYENFSQFLNTLRIKAILKKFDNPEYDHIPILTIALDGGFRSLSPFNKAFKDIMNQTPSQYRKSKHPALTTKIPN
ncbi:MAG: helix-turn-helix domain-containing protein [Hellea sp.]